MKTQANNLLEQMYLKVLPEQEKIKQKAEEESNEIEQKVLEPLISYIVSSVPQKLGRWFDSIFDYTSIYTNPERAENKWCLYKQIKEKLWSGPFMQINICKIDKEELKNQFGINSFSEFIKLIEDFNKNNIFHIYQINLAEKNETSDIIAIDWHLNKPEWVIEEETKSNELFWNR